MDNNELKELTESPKKENKFLKYFVLGAIALVLALFTVIVINL